jgi:thiamine-monophosphate kinase
MDVSDGLVGDLGHICEVSGVGAEIEAALVPLSAAARRFVNKDASALTTVLAGGDDYEILATVKESAATAFARDARAAGVPVTRIGRIVPGSAPVVLGADGVPVRLRGGGHAHF